MSCNSALVQAEHCTYIHVFGQVCVIWVTCMVFGNKKAIPSYFIWSPELVLAALLIWLHNDFSFVHE